MTQLIMELPNMLSILLGDGLTAGECIDMATAMLPYISGGASLTCELMPL